MRASLIAEKLGIPSVSVVETGYMGQARSVARALGVEEIPVAEYPGSVKSHGEEEQRERLQGPVAEAIVDGLTRDVEAAGAVATEGEPGPEDIALTGSLDEVDRVFHEHGWTDGLPVTPPTPERVREFLRFTRRSPDERIAVLAPAMSEATVWNVAVNGVMAGCRPEYMPLLLAIVECIADPEFMLEHAGSGPGWEPLVIVNGPLVEELGFNTGIGALRSGTRANSSIGRFLGLYVRNVAGLLPGTTSKAGIGSNFSVALAENESACREIGWLPLSTDTGEHEEGRNAVTLTSVVTATAPTYPPRSSPEKLLQHLRTFIGENSSVLWTLRFGLDVGRWSALFVLSPLIARTLAEGGLSKGDVRRYLSESCRLPVSLIDGFMPGVAKTIASRVESGVLPAEYAESEDPDRLVRVFPRPEWIRIAVAGDPEQGQARGYFNNHEQGFPVSREIEST